MFGSSENRKGFTLVELVVVIVILGILAGITIPSLLGYIRKANIAADAADASILANAATVYLAENPPSANVDASDLKTALIATTSESGYTTANWPKARCVNNTDMLVSYNLASRTVEVSVDASNIILPASSATGAYASLR